MLKPESILAGSFESDAERVGERVQEAISALIASMGFDGGRTQAFGRAIGVDKNIAWKLSRVLNAPSPMLALARMPGRVARRNLIERSRAAGAPEETLRQLRDALEELESLNEAHAGGQRTLNSLLVSSSGLDGGPNEEGARRDAFLGNSAIWGVQARCQFSAHFVAPSITPGMLDRAVISGHVDLRRLRPATPWTVGAVGCFGEDPLDVAEPLEDGGVALQEPPLVRRFCAGTLPPVRSVRWGAGAARFVLDGAAVGTQGSVTCMLGWLSRGAHPAHRSARTQCGRHTASLCTPAEKMRFDLFVHRDLAFAMDPELLLYSQMPCGPTFPMDGEDAGLLPLSERARRLRPGADLSDSEWELYPQAARFAAERLGRSVEEFHVLQISMTFPPIPTAVAYRYDLPQPA